MSGLKHVSDQEFISALSYFNYRANRANGVSHEALREILGPRVDEMERTYLRELSEGRAEAND